MLNAACVWLLKLKRHFPDELASVDVSRPDYVLRQARAWLMQARAGSLPARVALGRVARLSTSDRGALVRAMLEPDNVRLAVRKLTRRTEAERLWHGLKPLPGVRDIAE